MKVLIIRPNEEPITSEISSVLESMQEIVEGCIEVMYPFDDDAVIVCNDEGKLTGLPLNRAIYDNETHEMIDIIAGTFFICSAPTDSDNFKGLADEQIEKYTKRFLYPEIFVNMNGKILAVPVK